MMVCPSALIDVVDESEKQYNNSAFFTIQMIYLQLTYPGGEIGRRTILRGWRWQRRGSSNLLPGTNEIHG